MMRAMRLIPACALLAATTAHAGRSDTQEILELEQRWLQAAVQRDLSALDALLTDDFVDVSWQGRLRRKADVLHAPAVPVKNTQVLSELKVRFYGHTAVVTGLNTTTAEDHSFTARIRFTDVFVRQNGRWRAASAQETPEQSP